MIAAAASVAALALGPTPVAGWQEQDSDEESQSRPNILFLFADDQRPDTIGAWGNSEIDTPNIDELVADGFSFRNTYTFGSKTVAVCLPSRAMLMSGRTWFSIRSDLLGTTTLPEKLGDAGYRTFVTGKWHNGGASLRRSFDVGEAVFLGGFSNHLSVDVADLEGGRMVRERTSTTFSSTLFADAAIAFLDEQAEAAAGVEEGEDPPPPFFAYVSFTAPHDPFQAPLALRQRYYERTLTLPANFMPQHPFDNGMLVLRGENRAEWPRRKEVIRDQLAEYYGLISHLDQEIGRILTALEENGQDENTIVVYVADNGLAAGSHGLLAKASLYEHSMGVPMIIKGPGIPHGSTDALTYVHDLFPTVLGFAGVDVRSFIDRSDRSDLSVLWSEEEEARWRESLFLAFRAVGNRGIMRSVRDARYKLIVYPDVNHRQLFDLQEDPDELRNLIEVPEHAETESRLEGLLEQWQKWVGDEASLEVAEPDPLFRDLTGRERNPGNKQPEWVLDKYFRPQVIAVERREPRSEIAIGDTLRWRLTFRKDVSNVDGSDFQVRGEGTGELSLTANPVEQSERVYDVEASGGNLGSLQGVEVVLDFADIHDIKDGDGGLVPGHWVSGAPRSFTAGLREPPRMTVSPSTIRLEEGASGSYTVVLTTEPAADVTVSIAAPQGSDVSVDSVSLTFTPQDWNTVQTVTLTAQEDADAISDPAVSIEHRASGGGYDTAPTASAEAVVVENDAPVVSAEPSRAVESEGVLRFRVTLSVESRLPVQVAYACADGSGVSAAREGVDYMATSGTIALAAGSQAAEILVPLLDDDKDEEEAETFLFVLNSVTNASLAGGKESLEVVGTIEDDDDPEVEVSFGSEDYSVWEGGTVRVAVRLSRQPERAVGIPLLRNHGGGAGSSDYSGVPDEVLLAAGETVAEFTLRATDDEENDDGEELALRFGSLPHRVSGHGQATIAILDDDEAVEPPPGSEPTPPFPSPPPPAGGPGGPRPGPPASPTEPPDEEDGGGGGDSGGGEPLLAAVEVAADCEGGLCRVKTGVPLTFVNAGRGSPTWRSWEFGDGRTARSQVVRHQWSQPGFYEVTLRVAAGAAESRASMRFLVEAADPAGDCVFDGRTLCLRDSRFSVEVDWWTVDGESGAGEVVHEGTNESGVFHFVARDNWELLVKVLDGCGLNRHVWVFGVAATTLGYSIRVTDTVSGTMREYTKEPGRPAAAIVDDQAFPEGCGEGLEAAGGA